MSACLSWLIGQEQAEELRQGRHLQDGTWHRVPRAASPRAVGLSLAFPGLVETPLLPPAREEGRNQAVRGAVFGFLSL